MGPVVKGQSLLLFSSKLDLLSSGRNRRLGPSGVKLRFGRTKKKVRLIGRRQETGVVWKSQLSLNTFVVAVNLVSTVRAVVNLGFSCILRHLGIRSSQHGSFQFDFDLVF